MCLIEYKNYVDEKLMVHESYFVDRMYLPCYYYYYEIFETDNLSCDCIVLNRDTIMYPG